MQQQKIKEWLLDNSFTLEDVAEDNVYVYMKQLKVLTFIAEYSNNSFKFAIHVSWDGKKDNYSMFDCERFKIFHDCLSKLTIV